MDALLKNTKYIATGILILVGVAVLFLLYHLFLKPDTSAPIGLSSEMGDEIVLEGLTSEVGRELINLLNDLNGITLEKEKMQGAAFEYLETPLPVYGLTSPEEVPDELFDRTNPFAPVIN